MIFYIRLFLGANYKHLEVAKGTSLASTELYHEKKSLGDNKQVKQLRPQEYKRESKLNMTCMFLSCCDRFSHL